MSQTSVLPLNYSHHMKLCVMMMIVHWIRPVALPLKRACLFYVSFLLRVALFHLVFSRGHN